nr:uncharacterized protein p8a3.13c [Quercus suber]
MQETKNKRPQGHAVDMRACAHASTFCVFGWEFDLLIAVILHDQLDCSLFSFSTKFDHLVLSIAWLPGNRTRRSYTPVRRARPVPFRRWWPLRKSHSLQVRESGAGACFRTLDVGGAEKLPGQEHDTADTSMENAGGNVLADSPPPSPSLFDPTPPVHRISTPPESSYWSSPVPDLAATLQVTDAMDEEAENVSFLRHSVELLNHLNADAENRRESDRSRAGATTAQAASRLPGDGVAAGGQDASQRTRLQRVLERPNRSSESLAASTEAPPPTYGSRAPSPSRQSLYDWAPSARESDGHLEALIEQLRSQPSHDADFSRSSEHGNAQARDARGGSAGVMERRDRVRDRERRRREQEWVSLRQRAALQARSYRQGSPSATERMLRYVMERERSGLSEEEERARGQGWFRPSPSRNAAIEEHRNRDSWLLPPPAATRESSRAVPERSSDLRDRERQERVDAFRRGYLAENVPPRLPRISTPATTRDTASFLSNVMQYLSELRDCHTSHERFSVALKLGLCTREFVADKRDDFVKTLRQLEPLPDSSWLQPGTIFDGHQHATRTSEALAHQSHLTRSHSVEQINPNISLPVSNVDHAPEAQAFDATRPWLSHRFTPPVSMQNFSRSKQPQDTSHDRWPVRVVIHAVDPGTMSLQGTMEAYDVPQHPRPLAHLSDQHSSPRSDWPKAGRKNAPITTYMEGHIIDFSTHSFLTPSQPSTSTSPFPPATLALDAANWRKLPPFSHLASDDEFALLLLSRSRLGILRHEYIFMRWKERCFVHAKDDACGASPHERQGDTDREHGLTISGFYYVSLRRDSGEIEGLYFDPQSTPYQFLRLKGRSAGWPSLQLR